MRMARLIAAIAPAFLAGCALFPSDNTKPPAELVTFEQTLPVERVWEVDTGVGSDGHYLELEPWLADGHLYAANADGRVVAYEREEGSRVWTTDLGVRVTGGLNGGEGVAVLGTGDGEAIGLRRESGEEVWRTRLSSEVLSVSPVGLGRVFLRTNDGKLHAVGAATGEVAWQVGRKTPLLSLRGAGEPLVGERRVIVGFDNGQLAAVDIVGGTVVWETSISAPSGRTEVERMVDLDGKLAADGSMAYVATYHGRVAAVDVDSGRIRWARDVPSYAGVAIDRERVYVSDSNSHVWALNRDNGASVWKQDKLARRQVTAPAVIGDYLVVGDLEGYVHWIHRADGHFVARKRVGSEPILATPVVDGGRVYVLGSGGALAVFEPGEKGGGE